MVELMAAKRFAGLPRGNTEERPRRGVFPFWPRLPSANTAGAPRRWPEPATSAPGTPIAPATAPGATMPAGSAAARDLNDKRRLLQQGRRGRDRPASSKDISATRQPAAMADAFKNMGESPRFGRIRRNYHLCCKQIKVRNPMRRRLAPQSWIDSLVLPSSPSCAPSTPISTFPRRLRRGRG